MNIRQKTFVVFLFLTLAGLPAIPANSTFSGMVRDYAAMRLESLDMSVHEQTLDAFYEHTTDMGQLTLHPVVYSNPNKALQLDLAEAYFDFYLDSADVRVGKQKVIWGEAEGAFITDLVSPRDMRSFILADFSEIRKAVPAIKVDYYAGPYTMQGIWVTHFIPTSLPASNSMWAQSPTLPFPPAITSVSFTDPAMPETTLENSEIFLSLGHFGNAVSWKLNGGYVFTDEPLASSVTAPDPATRVISQRYERYSFIGGSFNTALGGLVLRGETALALDKPMNSLDTSKNPPITIEKHTQVQALVGLDWNMLGSQWSTQYLMVYTHDHTASLVSQMKPVKEFAHTFTFRMQDTFFDEQLTVRLFTYIEVEPLNALLRPSISYNFGNGVLLEGGLDVFLGDKDGTFGTYASNSLAWAALRWYF